MKPLQKLLLPAIFCWMALSSNANNLSITGLTVTQNGTVGGTVAFTVTWNNCWNLGSVSAPNNWDAAWLFVKFRSCSASPAVPYTHGTLSTTMSQHTIPSTLQTMTSLPQTSYYSAGGSTVINASTGTLDDPNGIMLSPVTAGTQSSVTGAVTLYVSNLPANSTAVTVEVVGIEMVYVPQGPYNLGDGSTTGSQYHFCASASSSNSALITSANETTTSSYYYMSGGTSSPALYDAAAIPAAWPKGYYAFYCMKYEISSDLYVQFLNTIGSNAAATRWIGSANYGVNRNYTSQTNSYTFSTARPTRAQNWLDWADWEAVLDWSCLRPMTEMEYEKACRGGSSTVANGAEQNEYPWQSTVIVAPSTISGAENGTEYISAPSNANCNYNAVTFSGGDGNQGPLRCGIFATSTSTQTTAGATYYGILDMAGNLREFVVQLHATAADDTFTRVVGDGNLVSVTGQDGCQIGDANQSTWPWPDGPNPPSGQPSTTCYGERGGDWSTNNSYGYDDLQTSSRYNCYVSGSYGNTIYPWYNGQSRQANNGGRGVR